jgi:antitoxin HigA-1
MLRCMPVQSIRHKGLRRLFEKGDARSVPAASADKLRDMGERIMRMKDPPHIGGFIRRQIVEPLGLSVTDAARALGVTRQALNNLLNEKSALSAEMALRIEKAFGPRMDHLLRMQLEYDMAQARKRESGMKVRRVRRAA